MNAARHEPGTGELRPTPPGTVHAGPEQQVAGPAAPVAPVERGLGEHEAVRSDERAISREARRRAELRRLRGINPGAAALGWLVTVGIAVLLAGIASAAGAAVDISRFSSGNPESDATSLTVAGGAVLTAILMVAYFGGGYAAGRMSRFAGAVQGLAVWVIGVLATAALAVASALYGAQYNVVAALHLPNLPVEGRVFSPGGGIALGAMAVLTLLAALAGGVVGLRYHHRVDRVKNAPSVPGAV